MCVLWYRCPYSISPTDILHVCPVVQMSLQYQSYRYFPCVSCGTDVPTVSVLQILSLCVPWYRCRYSISPTDILVVCPADILPVSAVTGEGLYPALDWLCMKLGSLQARRAITAPVNPEAENPNTTANGENSDSGAALPEDVELQPRGDYCSRAYSAIKCFFFRSNKQGRQSSPDTISTSSQEQ